MGLGERPLRFVSTHSRLKAAGSLRIVAAHILKVSTHSRLKAAGLTRVQIGLFMSVSTHSRLKAAGVYGLTAFFMCCFNTQPPEGGWLLKVLHLRFSH